MMADGSAWPSRSSDAGILRLPENARNGSARSPKVIRAETATAVIKYEVVMRGSPFSGTEVKGRIQSAAPGA